METKPISCNQFHNKPFHAGEMILIPRSSRLKGAAQAGSSLLSMFFDIPENSCDKLMLQSLSDICDSTDYNFEPVGIRYPLTPFLDTLIFCIKNGMSCAHLHNLMQRARFLRETGDCNLASPHYRERNGLQGFCHIQP